ncbi:TatD family hydrolase [Methanothermobacter sp.]|uniref:TatD family hydrolase n=1 Tax=Methanothermobacter sp. TaxID=1884223 RepID=UPI003C71AE94
MHADTRPFEDFELMAVSGVEGALTCAHDPLEMISSDVVMAHFQRLLTVDTERAARNGLKLYTALGIHPRAIPHDPERVIEKLPDILRNPSVVAVGEVGLDSGSEIEKDVFKAQLKVAEELGYPVIVHTPRRGKADVTPEIMDLIDGTINESLVVVEHVNREVLPELVETECMLGLTVQPEKLTPEEAVEILQEYGTERFVLNSDMSSAPSDPLSVPRTVQRMKMEGFSSSDIRRVSAENIRDLLKIGSI